MRCKFALPAITPRFALASPAAACSFCKRIVITVFLVISLASPGSAQTTMLVCNSRNDLVNMILSYSTGGLFDLRYDTSGWYTIEPGNCSDSVPVNPFQEMYFSFFGPVSDGLQPIVLEGNVRRGTLPRPEVVCADPAGTFVTVGETRQQFLDNACPEGMTSTSASLIVIGGEIQEFFRMTLNQK